GSRGHGYGGNIASGAGYFRIMNNIIGTNLNGFGGSAFGKYIDGGYNLLQDTSISLGKKSKRRVNVLLGPLQNNGGLTPTMELLIPSPATNRVPQALCPATDQRGVMRPAEGDSGDVGALEVVTRPIVLNAPLNTVTTNGSYTNLFAVALGDEGNVRQPLYYQWRLNGTNITGARQSYYFPAPTTTFTNQGGYDVVVQNSSGSVTSTPPAYFLFPPFMLTNPIAPVGVAQGSNLVLTATAIGTVIPGYPVLRYIWQLNGTNLSTTSLPSTGGSFTMLTTNLANHTVTMNYTVFGNLTNAGNYAIAVTNYYGGITSSICTVPVGVAITNPPPLVVYATIGQSVTLSVGADGSPLPTYSWILNGASTPFGTGASATTPPITANSVATVTVQNSVNSAVATVLILISGASGPPVIITQPTNQAVLPGSNVTFSVVASGGTNVLSYQWLFNASPSITSTITTKATLTLTNVQTNNSGFYSVQISDSQGETNSVSALLSVEVPPYIITQPTNQVVAPGSNATFSVLAGGGGLSFQWFFNASNSVVGGVVTNLITNTLQTLS